MVTRLDPDNNQLDLDLPGGAGPDTVVAEGGDDLIFTSSLGGSMIFGEEGNDTLVARGPNDTLFGGRGEDSLRVEAAAVDTWVFGGQEEDTIVALARAIIIGDKGDDFIQATAGDNFLSGHEGDDIILGGSVGRDEIYGGQGDDKLGFFSPDGNDNLDLNISGTFAGNEGSNTVSGDKGNDTIAGINNRDRLLGGEGDDSIVGRGNNVFMDGGDDNDTLRVINPLVNLPATIQGATQGIQGSSRNTLLGGTGDDYLQGGIGATFRGGQNLLDGGAGNDTMLGFAARDTLLGGAGNDFIKTGIFAGVEGPGGTLLGINNEGVAINQDGVPLDIPGYAGENILNGGDGDDTLMPGFLSDTVIAGNGNDRIMGIFQRADGEAGDDTINASGVTSTTPVTLVGGLGNDVLSGSASAPNVFDPGEGNDQVVFVNTADTLIGSQAGDDTIDARNIDFGTSPFPIDDTLGNNVIWGSVTTPNMITTGAGNDMIRGGSAPDTISAGAGNDIVDGFAGDDSIFGGAGNDTLRGGDGSDTLIGGDGNDWLYGGASQDTLIGGAGNDTFFYADSLEGGGTEGTYGVSGTLPRAAGGDAISEFVVGQDKLVFQQSAFGAGNLVSIVGPGGRRPRDIAFLQLEAGDPTYTDGSSNNNARATNGASPIFVYQADAGALLFDSNGTNPGGVRIIATIGNIQGAQNLTTTDVILI